MVRVVKGLAVGLSVMLILMTNACSITDRRMVVDENTEIDNQNWTYNNKVGAGFVIDDISSAYNLYFNLRVTADYKYSNIFVLIHETGPDKKTLTTRYEFKLADKDGEWLGQGTGNLYSYQVAYKTNYKFPAKGKYYISIEQNMRDNPLRQVSDAGLRVEKAE